MNEQTLEMQIKAKSQEATATVDKLVKSLTNIENVLTNIQTELVNVEKKSEQSLTRTSKNIKDLKSSADKATTSANNLGKALSLGGAYISAKKFTQTILGWLQETIDKTEQMNLFNVVFKNIEKDGVKTFSTLGNEAVKFQNKLNEAFGTNQTETLKYQALFRSMGDNQGIPEQYSALMSETMTKFTYDLASLYNKSETNTAEALRAGVFAGQTKPVRAFGLDITQTSMQPILDSLGINRQVKELSQAEKMILRYIAVLRQGQVAMGDFANTVESPANQMKVFKQQLVEAKVAFTSLFVGTFANVLPYANALLMIIKEVSKALADMFGIKLTDYNSGIASQEDAYLDLGDSIDDATGKLKELKRQTFGFDEIHNIDENTDSGSGGNITGGIDQRLLDAIKGYDNGMENIRMKATEIRDTIMGWLGFTKEIDPVTGEVQFKYQGIKKTLKSIWDSFSGLSTKGKILAGLGLATGATRLWSAGKQLVAVFGDTALGKTLSTLIGLLNPFTVILGTLIAGLGYVYNNNEQVRESVDNLIGSFANGLQPLFDFVSNTAIPNLKTAWEELLIILQPFVEFLNDTFISIWNDVLIPILQWLSDTVLPNVITSFENLWNDVLVPLVEFIGSILKPAIDILSDALDILWKNVVKPLADFLIGEFKIAWESVYEILNDTIVPILNIIIEIFNGVVEVTTFLWKNVLQPIVDFLCDVFGPYCESVCKSIGEAFGGLTQIFNGILDFITGIFTLNWTKAWNGITDIFGGIFNTLSVIAKTPLNAILGLFEGIINKIIDGWNWLKKQINTLSIEVPDWVPGIGGEKIGFNLSMSEHVSLPRFANGGTPEDGLFYANHNELVGKFNNGNTAVANNLQIEKGIEEASYRGYMRAIADSGIANGQSNQIDLHVHTDEGTIIDRIEQRTKQTGVFPFTIPIN